MKITKHTKNILRIHKKMTKIHRKCTNIYIKTHNQKKTSNKLQKKNVKNLMLNLCFILNYVLLIYWIF